jgi:hypothetical protein
MRLDQVENLAEIMEQKIFIPGEVINEKEVEKESEKKS